MKIKSCLFFSFLIIAALSCKQEGSGGKKVEQIPAGGPISEIIRNPATANQPLDTVNVARISFEETEFNFGEVFEGDNVVHTFNFSNTGKVPLLISDARSSCGCTVPEWPKQAIAPGERSSMKVVFNTTDRPEAQRKEVVVTANTYPSKTKIALTGYVRPKN
jgi:hypothetical protein